jgi:flagellar motor switch protein FliN
MDLSSASHNIAAALDRAEPLLKATGPRPSATGPPVMPFVLPELAQRPEATGLDVSPDAEVVLRVELGRARLEAECAGQLRPGSIVTLDKQSAAAVDIYAADRLVARGELVVIGDRFCVRVTEGGAARNAA